MADQPLFSLALWKLWLGHKKICFPYVDTHPGNSGCHFLDGSLHLGSPNGAVNYRFFPSFAPKQLQRQDMAPVVIHVNLDRMGHFMETDEFYRNLSLHLGRRFWHFWEEMWDFCGDIIGCCFSECFRDCSAGLYNYDSWPNHPGTHVLCAGCGSCFCQNVFAFPAEDQVLVDEWFCPLFPWHYQLAKRSQKGRCIYCIKMEQLIEQCYTEILERYHTSTSGNQFETKTSNGALDPAA